MKLLTQVSRVQNGKEYIKHWIVITPSLVKELKWKKGDFLFAKIKNGELVIKKID